MRRLSRLGVIAAALTVAVVGGCASDGRSGGERAYDAGKGALDGLAAARECRELALFCAPIAVVAGAVIGAVAPPPRPKGTSPYTEMETTAHDVAQAGILRVPKDSIKRPLSGAITATLLIDLEAPGKNGEKSYAVDVGVDCVDGGLETYRVESYAGQAGQGKLIHTQFAVIVKRSKPDPPLDAVVRAICDSG